MTLVMDMINRGVDGDFCRWTPRTTRHPVTVECTYSHASNEDDLTSNKLSNLPPRLKNQSTWRRSLGLVLRDRRKFDVCSQRLGVQTL